MDGESAVLEVDVMPATIRLIGVDTPETVYPSKSAERQGRDASAYQRFNRWARSGVLARVIEAAGGDADL